MSFTAAGSGADRSFELVRRSLLQDDSLPFAEALTADHIQQAFEAEGVSFGEADGDANASPEEDDGIVYTPAVTLWAMLTQALFTDVQRACRAAVQRVAVFYALLGREVSSTNTGAYCRARAKVTEGVVRRLAEGVAERCEAAVPDKWLWHGFRTLLIDGFRTESLVVVTSLVEHKTYTHNELAGLYRRRWIIELELRDIKSTMDLDVLRRQTPEAVRQELWTGLLAYNPLNARSPATSTLARIAARDEAIISRMP